MYYVSVDDFSSWRKQARELLKRQVLPNSIAWQYDKQTSLPFGGERDDFLSLSIKHPNPMIPSEFFDLAQQAACYRDDDRWPLLYSLAWRLVFDNRRLLDFKIDTQVARLFTMQKAVARDKHKMEAFVRFCLVSNPIPSATTKGDYFVAWFEPEHLIVPIAMPFFTKRFNNMSWSILTPDKCAHWDLEKISFTKGITRPPKIDDSLENLWQTYYTNIFNPARLKINAMQSEMPKKYWVNLPEAPLIAHLIRTAGRRADTMINDTPSQAWAKTAKSRYIQDSKERLRQLHNNDSK